MDFLVTMTTHVPQGTTEDTVAEVRQREAAHSHKLAERGSLRRLWRPPLQPGEWRTLGLFTADDADELESVLASMPLRIWRGDEVIPLQPHPNDPNLAGIGLGRECLIAMTIAVPDGTASSAVDDKLSREAQRARELSGQGHLRRLWALPAEYPSCELSACGTPATPRRQHPEVAALLPVDDSDDRGFRPTSDPATLKCGVTELRPPSRG